MNDKVKIPAALLLAEVASLLADGHEVTLPVKGRSMYPFVVGDRDSVVLRRAGNIRVGDVVLARLADGSFVLHRVCRMAGGEVTLRGDGNVAGVEVCSLQDICGRACAIVRRGRTVWCDSRSERFRVGAWRVLFPFRRVLLAVFRSWNKWMPRAERG